MIPWSDVVLLVVAPHPDDEVIGCGGLISKVKDAGGRVYVLYLTVGATADFSALGSSSVAERTAEIERVAAHFRLDGWRLVWADNRRHLRLDVLPQRDIIHEIERGQDISLEAVRPNVLVLPQFDDYNQDHRAAAAAAFAACRPAPRADKFVPDFILQAEAPMSDWRHGAQTTPALIVELSEEQTARKVAGMELYASQVRAPGHPRNGLTLEALARLRGSLIGVSFGEAFHCQRLRG